MLNIVPHIITQSYELGLYSGEFQGHAIIGDISGFTNITEKLQRKGKQGAEILTQSLNLLFDPIITTIYKEGGVISTFAGDAFTAIFLGRTTKEIHNIALNIKKSLDINKIIKTEFGSFEFGLKLGTGSGHIQFNIIDRKNRAVYYFYGEGIKKAVYNLEKAEKGGIVFDKGSSNIYSNTRRTHFTPSPSTQYAFYPGIILDKDVKNSFRSVVSMFINIEDSQVQEVIKYMLDIESGGYVNKVDYGDKGYVALVVFGAPISKESDIKYALLFANKLTDKFKNSVRIGITFNTVFAGIVGNDLRSEYTVIGKGVNLAARLMQKSEYGTTLTDKSIAKFTIPGFIFKFNGTKKLKGFSNPIQTYKPSHKPFAFLIDRQADILGRTKEKRLIKRFVKNLLQKNNNLKNLLIVGKEGTGKTSLCHFAISYLKEKQYDALYGYFDFKKSKMVPDIEIIREFFTYFFNTHQHGFDEFLLKIKSINKPLYKELKSRRDTMESILSGKITEEKKDFNTRENKDILTTTILFLFKAIATTATTMLVFDNIDNADHDTLRIIEKLLQNTQLTNSLSILLTVKDRMKLKTSRTIVLNQLKEEDIEDMISKIFGKKPHSSLTSFIYNRSKGNPLFAKELSLLLLNKKLLTETGGYVVAKKEAFDLPDTIQHIYTAMYDSFPSDIRTLLRTLSIMGDSFNFGLLKKIATFPLHTLRNLLESLILKDIIVEVGEGRFAFKNSAFRESVYSLIPFKEKRKIHKKIAHILDKKEEKNTQDVFALFYHYNYANIKTKTIYHGFNALKIAEDLFLNDEILKISLILLKLIPKASQKHGEILLKRAGALFSMGRIEESMHIYNNLIQNSTGILKGWALYKSAYIINLKGNRDEALKRLNEAIKVSRNKKLKLRVLVNLAILYLQRSPQLSLEYLKNALLIANKINDKTHIAKTYINIGITVEYSGNLDKSLKYYEKAKTIFEELGNVPEIFNALQLISINYAKRKDLKKATTFIEQAYTVALQYGFMAHLKSILINLGNMYGELGKFRKALNYLKKAEALSSESGDNIRLAIVSNSIAETYLRLNYFKKALEYSNKAIKLIKHIQIPYYEGIFLLTRAEIELKNEHYNNVMTTLKQIEVLIKKHNELKDTEFDLTILKARTLYEMGKKEKSFSILKQMCNNTKDTERKTLIKFYLWKNTKDTTLKNELLKEISLLYNKFNTYEFKSLLDELSASD